MATNFPFDSGGDQWRGCPGQLGGVDESRPCRAGDVLGARSRTTLPALNTGKLADDFHVQSDRVTYLPEAASRNFPDDLLKLPPRSELARRESLSCQDRIPRSTWTWRRKIANHLWAIGPARFRSSSGLSVVTDFAVGIRSNVQIALIPTDDPSTIPSSLASADALEQRALPLGLSRRRIARVADALVVPNLLEWMVTHSICEFRSGPQVVRGIQLARMHISTATTWI